MISLIIKKKTVLYDESMAADGTMAALDEIDSLVGEQCSVSGMAAVINDIRKLSEKEAPVYVMIAVVLSLAVLSLTMDSVIVPFLFLLSIGMAIVYNLGTNIFKGEISYVTQECCSWALPWTIPFSCGTAMRNRRRGIPVIKTGRWHMPFPTRLLPLLEAPLQQLQVLSHSVS